MLLLVRNLGMDLGDTVFIGLLLGIYLFASLPLTAAWLLGILFGIQLLSEGAALAYMTWNIRKA